MPRNPDKRRCARESCRAWAMHDSLYCRAHRPEESASGGPLWGIYAAALTPEERRLFEQAGDPLDLEPEIRLLRVMSRRLFMAIGREEVDQEKLRKLASVLYQGFARLAQLLRTRRAVSGAAGDGLAGALAQALDEIGNLEE